MDKYYYSTSSLSFCLLYIFIVLFFTEIIPADSISEKHRDTDVRATPNKSANFCCVYPEVNMLSPSLQLDNIKLAIFPLMEMFDNFTFWDKYIT